MLKIGFSRLCFDRWQTSTYRINLLAVSLDLKIIFVWSLVCLYIDVRFQILWYAIHNTLEPNYNTCSLLFGVYIYN